MMKTYYVALCLFALAGLILSGCTTATETTTTTQAQTDQTTKRVHTQEELRKSGQSETGPALEKTDAAVQTSGPR
jgi:outer membrane biogenesis lipoprotein LolB